VAAAALCEEAGADGITAHLREDRRHIQDEDIHRLVTSVRTVLNLEMAVTEEMLSLAERVYPYQVTLVPEHRDEVTTEGGLDLSRGAGRIASALDRLKRLGVRTSLFIDPVSDMVLRARDLGAVAIELHTGGYANGRGDPRFLEALRSSASLGRELGLAVHAGHGLTTGNVAALASIPEVEELNIGHSIVSRALFVGLVSAVTEIRTAMNVARSPVG
jgi:pyridoxine 5-phosphate synthase